MANEKNVSTGNLKALCNEGKLPVQTPGTRHPVIELFKGTLICGHKDDKGTQVCTSVSNFNRLLSDAHQSEFVRKSKHFQTSWSVYKSFRSLFKVQTAVCEGMSDVRPTLSNLDEQANKLAKLKNYRMLEKEVEDFISSETRADRMRRVFTEVNPVTNEPSSNVKQIKGIAMQAFLGSFLFGFYKGSLEGKEGFMKRNKGTLYATKSMAHKRMYNTTIQTGMKSGIKWSVKGMLFIMPILFIDNGLAVYYNKTSPLNLTAGCGVVCSLSRLNLGPKGMFAGAIIGSVFGFLGGCFLTGALKMCDMTQDKLTYNDVKAMLEFQRSNRPPITQDDLANFDDMETE